MGVKLYTTNDVEGQHRHYKDDLSIKPTIADAVKSLRERANYQTEMIELALLSKGVSSVEYNPASVTKHVSVIKNFMT